MKIACTLVLCIFTSMAIYGQNLKPEMLFPDTLRSSQDSWICSLESIVNEKYNNYELAIDSANNYLVVGRDEIIKVSSDGELIYYIENAFEKDSNQCIKRIFDGQILCFYSGIKQKPIDEQRIYLKIYNETGVLQESLDLQTKGYLYDVEIERKNVYGLLLSNRYGGRNFLQRVHKDLGVLGTKKFKNFRDMSSLTITSSKKYLASSCSGSKNLSYLDVGLRTIWNADHRDILVCGVAPYSEKGVYITGSTNDTRKNYVALAKDYGAIAKRYEYSSYDTKDSYHVSDVVVNDKYVVVTETDAEIKRTLRILVFNHDLELISTYSIEGLLSTSNLVENENKSFSFVYSQKVNQADSSWTQPVFPRIFKLDQTLSIPDKVIVQ